MRTTPNQHVSVAIFRPDESDIEKLMSGSKNSAYGEKLDEVISSVRDMVEQAGDEQRIKTFVNEFQLHDLRQSKIASAARAHRILLNDVLVGFDPDPGMLSVLATQSRHPLQRSIIAFTDREMLFTLSKILGMAKTPSMSANTLTFDTDLRRVFPIHTSLNTELEANDRPKNMQYVTAALQYPFIKPTASKSRNAMEIIDGDMDEGKPEFKPHLVAGH